MPQEGYKQVTSHLSPTASTDGVQFISNLRPQVQRAGSSPAFRHAEHKLTIGLAQNIRNALCISRGAVAQAIRAWLLSVVPVADKQALIQEDSFGQSWVHGQPSPRAGGQGLRHLGDGRASWRRLSHGAQVSCRPPRRTPWRGLSSRLELRSCHPSCRAAGVKGEGLSGRGRECRTHPGSGPPNLLRNEPWAPAMLPGVLGSMSAPTSQ